jgi:RNA-binding protein
MSGLTSRQNKYLRGLAHDLNPVVQLGQNGVSNALVKEIDRCLADHELIKIRVACDDQVAFRTILEEVEALCGASTVQAIGHTVVLYRRAAKPKIIFPD